MFSSAPALKALYSHYGIGGSIKQVVACATTRPMNSESPTNGTQDLETGMSTLQREPVPKSPLNRVYASEDLIWTPPATNTWEEAERSYFGEKIITTEVATTTTTSMTDSPSLASSSSDINTAIPKSESRVEFDEKDDMVGVLMRKEK